MGELKDFINLYIQDSSMIPDLLSEVTLNLVAKIQKQLYPKHGWITGDLHDSFPSGAGFTVNKKGGVVEVESSIYYDPFVEDGHHSFGGYHHKQKGLEETVAMYR